MPTQIVFCEGKETPANKTATQLTCTTLEEGQTAFDLYSVRIFPFDNRTDSAHRIIDAGGPLPAAGCTIVAAAMEKPQVLLQKSYVCCRDVKSAKSAWCGSLDVATVVTVCYCHGRYLHCSKTRNNCLREAPEARLQSDLSLLRQSPLTALQTILLPILHPVSTR
jgi:hypothetical protein